MMLGGLGGGIFVLAAAQGAEAPSFVMAAESSHTSRPRERVSMQQQKAWGASGTPSAWEKVLSEHQ